MTDGTLVLEALPNSCPGISRGRLLKQSSAHRNLSFNVCHERTACTKYYEVPEDTSAGPREHNMREYYEHALTIERARCESVATKKARH
jgi:hypothetical protein